MARTCHDCGFEFVRHGGGSALRCWTCWRARERIGGNAIYQVRLAVLAGKLPDLRSEVVPCSDCGARANRYDHRNYSRPLDVEPVCHPCNLRRGPAARLTVELVSQFRSPRCEYIDECLALLQRSVA